MSTGVCKIAAHYGHLGVLKWAVANGCECDQSITSEAAYGGHIHVLKWALENGWYGTKTLALLLPEKTG